MQTIELVKPNDDIPTIGKKLQSVIHLKNLIIKLVQTNAIL